MKRNPTSLYSGNTASHDWSIRSGKNKDDFCLRSGKNDISLRSGQQTRLQEHELLFYFRMTERMMRDEATGKLAWPNSSRFIHRGISRSCVVEENNKDEIETLLERYGCNWQEDYIKSSG